MPSSKEQLLTAEEAREILHYDGQHLRWKQPRQRRTVGEIAGSDRDGYKRICINGKRYEAHRLVWLIVKGDWPTHQIDHIDGDKTNNRIENLRDVTNRENCLNQKLHVTNSSGHVGVYHDKKRHRWRASIMLHGKTVHLGAFKTADEAIAARQAAQQQHGFHENHGKR